MSNVPESASYDAGIYQLETVDEVLGGVNGKANAQAKGLANRTNWLKAQVDALNLLKGKGVAAFSIANSYVAGEIVDYQKNIYRANTTVTPGAWNASQWNKLLGTAAESELASVAPVMNGVAAVGVSTQLARQDHVHPADTGREPAITGDVVTKFWSGTKAWRDLATDVRAAVLTGLSLVTSTVVASTDSILVAIGKLQAQVTLLAPLAGPTFTGAPAAPTPANGTNTTQLATTAFVQSQIASSVPAASETVAGKVELATAAETTTGTDNTRAVHPAGLKVELDKKAPLASPALTGTPTAPTASAGTNTTQLATTAFVQASTPLDLKTSGISGSFANLKASATGTNATVTVTAYAICLKNASNEQVVLNAVSVAPSLAASGANGLDTGVSAINTWYYVWVIWNGTTTAGLLSLSATAPTMPGGYTHKARVGAVRTDGTANKYPLSYTQFGNSARYKLAAGSNVTATPVMSSGAVTWPSAVAVGAFVPPTASHINLSAYLLATNTAAYVAPNATYAPTDSPITQANSNYGGTFSAPVPMLLESTNIYYGSGVNTKLLCFGWEDNL